MPTKLAYRRKAYLLWFSYLQTAYNDPRPEVRAALQRSKAFYGPWGDVTNAKFHEWWKDKGHLFEDKYVVRQLAPGEAPFDPEALIIEVPLRQSASVLTNRVAELIKEAVAKLPKASTKGGKSPTAEYKLSKGAEPKLEPLNQMLTVYRDVYLRNPKARGKQLLVALEHHYLGRKQKRFRQIPKPFVIPADAKAKKLDLVLRNVNRYIRRAEKIVLNVAGGEFPGKY
jgi:hypothetical protein